MPVSATIVAQVQTVTVRIVTTVNVPAKGSRTAFTQSMQGTQLPAIGTITGQVFPVALQHLGYFVSSVGHGYKL
jgi:hypothetical protein